MENIVLDMGQMDWALLREQKHWLVKNRSKSEKTRSIVEGLLGMLDHIQDEAAKQLGEEVVFGPEVET